MIEAKQPKRFVIIDGKSVFYRGYFALPNLSTKDGIPTGGVFGFASMALEVIRKLKPDYVAVAWDKPKTNIRKRLKMYPEYKAGRKPPPPDFYEQIPILHELLQAFGWPLYELDDYEADDIMGALALQAQEKGIETLLVTSDLDALQLIGPLTKIFVLKTGISHIELYSSESFKAKYGLDATQFLDLKAIKGDSSDNIPGVPGIGEKGATELLQKYKTLDGVYDNLALVKDQLRKKLEAGKELAYLSKKLGAIWTDAPIKLDLKEVDGSKLKPDKVVEMLNKLEFRSLAKQLPEVMQSAISDHQISTGSSPLNPGKNIIIDNDQKLSELRLPNSEHVYIHSRAAGKQGNDPQVLIISTDGQTLYTLDLTKISKEKFSSWWTIKTPLVGYDLKSTLKVLINLGCYSELPPVGHDVLIGAYLLNSLRREQTLSELAQADLNYEGSPFEDFSPDEVTLHAPDIIAVLKGLYAQQSRDLIKIPTHDKLAKDIEWPVIPVLAQMEHVGIKLDTAYLQKMSVEVDDMISDLEQQIYGHAGEEFNIGSPVQLANILFSNLHLGLSTTGVK